MNTHLKQLWAAMKLPEKLQKKLYFFCRGLDIRVSNVVKNIILLVVFVVCLALIVIGQKNIGATGLMMELIGLAGLLVLLYLYNRKYK